MQFSSFPEFPAGNKVEKVCDLCSITLNKNAVFGDSSALAPGGVRVGKNSYTCLYLIFGNLYLALTDRWCITLQSLARIILRSNLIFTSSYLVFCKRLFMFISCHQSLYAKLFFRSFLLVKSLPLFLNK